MQIDGQEIELVPGRYVLVHPEYETAPGRRPRGSVDALRRRHSRR